MLYSWIVELSIVLHSGNSFLHYALKLTVFWARREEKVKQRGALGEAGQKIREDTATEKKEDWGYSLAPVPLEGGFCTGPRNVWLLHVLRLLPF